MGSEPLEAPPPSSLPHRLGLPSGVSRIAVALLGVFLLVTLLSIDVASAWLIGTKDWVVGYFDWLFVGVASLAVVAVVVIGLHPRANVRLGADDSEPEFGTLAWFAMLFSAGLASGLLYWATAEPVLHFQGNPFLDRAGVAANSAAAMPTALLITVMHWGLHGWAFYVLAALGIGVYSYRHGLPLTFRTALAPLLGRERLERWPGRAVDLLATVGTVCGVATSMGLIAGGMNATLNRLLGLGVGLSSQTLIVFGVAALGVASAVSGVGRGIRRLSEVNLWVSAAFLLAFLALGPTAELGGVFLTTTRDYVLGFASAGLWVAETAEHQDWQSAWTVFYWGWWLAWTPFVSLFVARISKGRSVREFVLAVTLVPSLVILVWMSVLGGTALHQELASPGAVSTAVNQDYSLGIVTVIANLAPPHLATALTAVAAFLLFTWLITSLDSATLVICHLLETPDQTAPKVFWGVSLATVTCALLWMGGVAALQAASIVIGLPLAGLVLLLGFGLLRDTFRGRI